MLLTFFVRSNERNRIAVVNSITTKITMTTVGNTNPELERRACRRLTTTKERRSQFINLLVSALYIRKA